MDQSFDWFEGKESCEETIQTIDHLLAVIRFLLIKGKIIQGTNRYKNRFSDFTTLSDIMA